MAVLIARPAESSHNPTREFPQRQRKRNKISIFKATQMNVLLQLDAYSYLYAATKNTSGNASTPHFAAIAILSLQYLLNH